MDKNNNTGKIASAWSTGINPLRGLTKNQIDRMLDLVRRGNDVRLQTAFFEMERTTPVFGICLNKRLAGVANRKWAVEQLDSTPESARQRVTVEKVLRQSDTLNLDGLTEAIRHLASAVFRGRAAVKPFISDNGQLHFKCLDNWNVLEWNNRLYWNPNADEVSDIDTGLDKELFTEIPEGEVCWLKESRPIDIPGIQIYLRQLVGEETWARATEKYGIAQVMITAPEGTPDSALPEWTQRAYQIFEGGSGVLPNGAKADILTQARGQDPFSLYIQHQMELISILATGGTLATVGGNTGLGSNLADVQNDQFNQLVTYDCKRIANAITNVVIRKIVRRFFNTDEVRVRFNFIETEQTKPAEYILMAQRLVQLGFRINGQELKRLTGLSFIEDVDEEWSPKAPAEGRDGDFSTEEKHQYDLGE